MLFRSFSRNVARYKARHKAKADIPSIPHISFRPFLAFDEMTKLSALATAAILAGSASAHTIFQKLYVNGVDQGELVGIRAPDYDGVRAPPISIPPFSPAEV